MKILILTLDSYPHCGGKSTHISSLLDGLNCESIDCKVVSKNDISRIKMNLYKLMIYSFKFFNLQKYEYLRRKHEFKLFKQTLKKELKNNYEYASCQDALSCTALGQINFKGTITLTMHTYFGLEYTLDNNLFSIGDRLYENLLSLEEESLKYAKNVIGVDERIYNHVKDTINKKYNSCTNKINVTSIVNFTNTNLYNDTKIEHDDFNILCVRRLVEKNGVIYAVEAMKYLKKYSDIKLHIYGNGPCMNSILDCIKSNDLTNVIMHGAIDNSLLPDIYKTADSVVVPSITVNGLQEATSISAIEAMSCSIPVIASDIGGLSQMIKTEENGLLVNETDSKELAKAILYLYNDKTKANEISKNARKYILKNHSHMIAAKQYLKIFLSE